MVQWGGINANWEQDIRWRMVQVEHYGKNSGCEWKKIKNLKVEEIYSLWLLKISDAPVLGMKYKIWEIVNVDTGGYHYQ